MAQGYLIGLPQRLLDADGEPAAGWKIYTWTPTGTFTVPLTTYSTATLSATNTNPIITDASGYFRAFVGSGTLLDIQVKNAADVLQFTLLSVLPAPGYDPSASFNRSGATDSNGTYTLATLPSPTITGDGIAGVVAAKRVSFTETATGVSHVATIAIPPGGTLLDILVSGGVLWGAAAAVLKVGDTANDSGYFTAVNVKATDLLPGETLSVSGSTSNWGGKNGAYLVAATGQRGPTSANFGTYYLAGSNIVATITVTTPSVTTGRTYLTVLYALGQVTAPVVT